MVSKAQKEASARYDVKSYDKILLRLRKDSKVSKLNIQSAALKQNESINAYIVNAIKQRMEQEQEREQ